MKAWDSRPEEVAYLLNPAFCGRIIHQCIQVHCTERSEAMPYCLAFLVLPLVLHPATRSTFHSNTRHFQVWLNSSQHIKLGLAARARALVPHTREALTLLCQAEHITVVAPDAGLQPEKRFRRASRGMTPASAETRDCLSKAALLGKWFARTNSPATIYTSLGLMP